MKIGLYMLDMPPSLGGGYVLRDDLVRHMVASRGRHTYEPVAIPPEDPLPPSPPPKSGLRRRWDRFRRVPDPVPPARRSAHQRLTDEVRARQFDLLWFNHFDPIHTGVPYIVNVFDLQHRLQPWFPEVSNDGKWELREKMAWTEGVRRAAAITTGSEEAKDQVCHFYGVARENVFVLPFPTPQKAIEIAEGRLDAPQTVDVRAKYGLAGDFLFYPAQLWSHKNHANLFHALKLLRGLGRQISLVLTGADHGNRAHLEGLAAALGISDLVHFCGFVPYEDILSFYKQARALAYVSFFGPENLPPLEAMALECPVILSDIPGVRALHGDGPVLVDPRDPASIARGIEFVLDNPEHVRDAVKSGKTVALQNNCEKYLERFESLLDRFTPYRRCWP